MKMSRILIADDDAQLLESFSEMLTDLGHEVVTATNGSKVLDVIDDRVPDLLVMDIRMPGLDGIQTLRELKARDAKVPVIIMTGYGTADVAIEATKLGAYDYHLKPFEPDDMLRSIEGALECARLMTTPVLLKDRGESPAGDALVGVSESMQAVYVAIGRVAQTDAAVLIRGETGTGKELVARAVYQHSARSKERMVVVNCAAIPETLIESELFGYERGSFTGARERRIGKFEQANGGTIFLDEIGDLGENVQPKLLRVLQTKTFERVGGNEPIHGDVRILAATNQNLEELVAQGSFREDLYHRLKVFTIDLPPLRERRGDIPLLSDYFLNRFARQNGLPEPILTPDAVEKLASHEWPGNVRELENCLHRAVILTHGFPIRGEDIARDLDADGQPAQSHPGSKSHDDLRRAVRELLKDSPGRDRYAGFLETVNRILLTEALHLTEGNQTRAAKLLGLTRSTFITKLDRYGVSRDGGPIEPAD